MKKILAFLTAAGMALAIGGCWNGSEQSGATFEVNLDQSYTAEQFVINGKSTNIRTLCTTDKGVFLQYEAGRNMQKGTTYVTVFYDPSTEEYSEAALIREFPTYTIIPMSEGRFAALYLHGKQKDWEYDEEYFIDIYDSNMQYLETRTIPEVLGQNSLQFCKPTFNNKDELLYVTWMDDHFSIIVLDEQMQEKDIITAGEYSDIIMGTDGEIYICSNSLRNIGMFRVDTEQGRLVPIKLSGEVPDYETNVLSGTCGYTLYVSNDDGIYGFTIDDTNGTCEKKMDFVNSDFLDVTGYYTCSVPDGGFLLPAGENGSSSKLWLAHERTAEQKDSVQVISLAGIDLNNNLKEVVCNYNRSQEEYRIVMVDYMKDSRVLEAAEQNTNEAANYYYYNALNDAAIDYFWQDLIAGIVPDMICTDGLPFQQLAGKKMFVDLSEFMEKDERFHPDDYVMNFYDSMKYKGELQTMGFSFMIKTVGGKTELVGNKQGLTPEEYLAMIDSRPEDTIPMQNTLQEWYLRYFLNNLQSSFMDTEKASCSFDDPAFAKLLEVGKTMPGGYDTPGWDDANKKPMLLMDDTFSQPIAFHEMTAGHFGGADITLVGYPTTDGGNGGIFTAPFTLSINAKSQYQAQAWDICMNLLSGEIQNGLFYGYGQLSFPVLRSALENDLHAATLGMGRTTYTADGEVATGNATEEEMTVLMDYIEHINRYAYTDPQIETIISEEAQMYFAGDQTAEEAAKMIQSRASLYISEQY